MLDYIDQLSISRTFKDINNITDIAQERLSGTEVEKEVSRYIQTELQGAGVDTHLHYLDGLVSFPISGRLKILAPEAAELPCSVFAQGVSTPKEGLEGEVVYLGEGKEERYNGLDVKNKIVLLDLSYDPPRPEKVRIATVNGALAVVMANWGSPEFENLTYGTVKAPWGNPTPEDIKQMPKIPVVSIMRKDGDRLIELCRRGKVTLWIKSECTREWRKIIEPLGFIQGNDEPEKFIVVGGHYDAWNAGVTCNATGNAVTMEIARVLAQNQPRLKRSVVIGFWPGHETGIMEGSTWYVDHNWSQLQNNGIAYLNIDSPGMLGASRFVAWSTAELKLFARQVAAKFLKDTPYDEIRQDKIGDQSFFGIGIPSLFGLSMHSHQEIAKWKGAILGWWYHSDLDTIDKVDENVLMRDLRCNAGFVWEMLNRDILPFEFCSVADEFTQRLSRLEKMGEKHDIDISSLIELNNGFTEKAKKLEQLKGDLKKMTIASEQIKNINKILMKLCRYTLPVRHTVIGRYGQDTYGLSDLKNPLPGLTDLERLERFPVESENYKTHYTRAMRRRNQCYDALNCSLELLKEI